ncbi:MAG: hypothetical protein AAF213_11875, partial [Pseudomonadota bacterium]
LPGAYWQSPISLLAPPLRWREKFEPWPLPLNPPAAPVTIDAEVAEVSEPADGTSASKATDPNSSQTPGNTPDQAGSLEPGSDHHGGDGKPKSDAGAAA